MKKSGLSMTSMALYVVLFFVFTTFAITISSNMNYKTLSDKGDIWINEQYDKLQMNMLNSAKQSNEVNNINGRVVFSNNDEYIFDYTSNRVLKNGGIIAMDITVFEIIDVSSLDNKPNDFKSNLDNDIQNISLNIELKKYGQEKKTQMFLSVGESNVY